MLTKEETLAKALKLVFWAELEMRKRHPSIYAKHMLELAFTEQLSAILDDFRDQIIFETRKGKHHASNRQSENRL